MGERRPPSLTLSCVCLALVGFINRMKERYPAVQSKEVCFLDADSCRSECLLKGGDPPSGSCLTPAPSQPARPRNPKVLGPNHRTMSVQNLEGHEKSLPQKKNQFPNSLVGELRGDQIVLLPLRGALAGGCECVLTGFRCAGGSLVHPRAPRWL